MPRSRAVLPKPNKGGRPATGRDPVRTMRLSEEFVTKVDAWAAAQDDHPGRTEAIRRLVEMSLKSVSAPKPARNVARSARAAELAAKAIDKLGDPAASTEERDERRRRLTKGPPEFREDRVDRPKVKK
jgi:hypothetical protein